MPRAKVYSTQAERQAAYRVRRNREAGVALVNVLQRLEAVAAAMPADSPERLDISAVSRSLQTLAERPVLLRPIKCELLAQRGRETNPHIRTTNER
jgi:hypothetical protein